MKNFKIQISDNEISDLKQRLANTRWPADTINEGWKKGVPTEYLKGLADYWQHTFDWKKQESLLNQYPHFITQIDGQAIHYLHIQSPVPEAIPLLLLHGWPGSFADFTKVIEPLTKPENGDVAFHLVIPSIPGFGFSVPVQEKGWNMMRMASAFTELMKQIGYERFAVHGGDMGAGITGIMSGVAAYHLIGTHVNTDFYSVAGWACFQPITRCLPNRK